MAQVTSLKVASQETASEPPAQWSYSAAKAFGDCPKRWHLSRIKLSHFSGPLPRSITKAALEGTLLHELLKKYAQASNGFKPRKELKLLLEEQIAQHTSNLRDKVAQLAQRISLDKILNHFHQFYPRVSTAPVLSAGAKPVERQYGSEVYVRDPQSKLFGIIDYIDYEGLTDFKTGFESDDHRNQVLFYGALWMARWGHPPRHISVTYMGESDSIDFSPALLTQVLNEWRGKAEVYDSQIQQNKVVARPSCEQCPRCPVRALCGDYWSEIYPKLSQTVDSGFSDYMPKPSAVLEKNVYGYYIRDTFAGQESTLLIDIPDSITLDLSDLRLLGVQIKRGEKRLQLLVNENTEVFNHCPDF